MIPYIPSLLKECKVERGKRKNKLVDIFSYFKSIKIYQGNFNHGKTSTQMGLPFSINAKKVFVLNFLLFLLKRFKIHFFLII